MFVRFCSNFHNTTTIRQCVYGGKIGAEGSVSQSSYATLKFHRTLTDKNRISTGAVTHEFPTNRIVTDSYRTSNGRLSPFCPVESSGDGSMIDYNRKSVGLGFRLQLSIVKCSNRL